METKDLRIGMSVRIINPNALYGWHRKDNEIFEVYGIMPSGAYVDAYGLMFVQAKDLEYCGRWFKIKRVLNNYKRMFIEWLKLHFSIANKELKQ